MLSVGITVVRSLLSGSRSVGCSVGRLVGALSIGKEAVGLCHRSVGAVFIGECVAFGQYCRSVRRVVRQEKCRTIVIVGQLVGRSIGRSVSRLVRYPSGNMLLA